MLANCALSLRHPTAARLARRPRPPLRASKVVVLASIRSDRPASPGGPGDILSRHEKAVLSKIVHGERHMKTHFTEGHPEKAHAAEEYLKQLRAEEYAKGRDPNATAAPKRASAIAASAEAPPSEHSDPAHSELSRGEKAAIAREVHGTGHVHFTEKHPELAQAAQEYAEEVREKDRERQQRS